MYIIPTYLNRIQHFYAKLLICILDIGTIFWLKKLNALKSTD